MSGLEKFNKQIPLMLRTIENAIRGGYSLVQAFEKVASDVPAPRGQDVQTFVNDLKYGQDMEKSLSAWYKRTPSGDLDLVLATLRVQFETGGNLAEILDTVSETVRERVRIKGELRALTSQQRMAGYVLAALPIVVFFCLMALNPTYEARLFMPGPTLCIPIGAALMMLVGFLIIRRIINLDV